MKAENRKHTPPPKPYEKMTEMNVGCLLKLKRLVLVALEPIDIQLSQNRAQAR